MNKVHSMLWGIRFRLSLLYHYLFNKKVRRRTTWHEMLYHLFSPRMYKVANEKATLVNKDEKYCYYQITGYEDLFIYPATAPFYSFAMIITEARPQHWHYYEIPQTAIAPGDVVVDCGSAEGFFAFRHQYTAGRIYILEPLRLFIDSLQQLFGQKDNVVILPVAAGDTCQKAYINMTSDDTVLNGTVGQHSENSEAIEVDVVTIDSLFADKGIMIDYLKADIEGFEENMIRGAIETIRTSKPKIAITTYHKGQDYEKLIALIKSVVPEYNYLVKGIHYLSGNPVMLHMWI
ncbi:MULTISPECIES: FkbM family methyltransferase [unclassified Pedobacter]|uniref:FkbM family methyltransferase n=1 Tax=unclassified Pedobacter TaxID=2628915 RepID=UPI001422543E|nr:MULTISPECIES: FkbM family methyltransferase [unclassified Pedobacter]NII80997.1 FkbM family methyltransferase [Pedobacter sp. SG908]NMN35012.1 FkbM family methyltransferase [Pedobacter sp. SG918]